MLRLTRIIVLAIFGAALLPAVTGYDAWLRYSPVANRGLPATVVRLGDAPTLRSAQAELIRGVKALFGRTLRASAALVNEDSILLGTVRAVNQALPNIALPGNLAPDGFALETVRRHGHKILLVVAQNERGVLYGAFDLLRRLSLGGGFPPSPEVSNPAAPVRWINQWDNLDGSIERGYAGRSIFFSDQHVSADLTRAGDYARLLASVGINGCTVNNVNASPRMLAPDFLPQIARIADAFRPWGVQLSIAVDFSSPQTLGGLNTFDPLDPHVAKWWRDKADEIYRLIPDFGGFVLKADSEGRVGPSRYGRTHADAANVLAAAVRSHGGIAMYRAFVYDHHMDWRNLKNDRARAAYDNFHPLDGKFAANVMLQIKYGPIDFQAREPVSPLFAGLRHTNEAIELQITQEYTGQQRHLCYLVPMWKEALDFNTGVGGENASVKNIASGRRYNRPLGGFVGVANVGLDMNWLGNYLALANLYGFGRLAWNPNVSAREITDEWTRQTFGSDPRVVSTINSLELASWRVYEGYTGPLGMGTLTDILHGHYGPGIESAERNGWGQWFRADEHGLGMDRTTATGTGYIGQYPPAVAQRYESLTTCPDDLLLFMHHVPYRYRLHSGATLVQYVYDSHYTAAEEAQSFADRWRRLRGLVDEDRYQAVLTQLEYQAGHAVVWREAICAWFLKMSGIPDNKGRVGHDPARVEAESMQLRGYQVMTVTPAETASGGKAIVCKGTGDCTAAFQFRGTAGWYTLDIFYYDEISGDAEFQLRVGDQTVSHWQADAALVSKVPNGDTATRQRITGIALRPGDRVQVIGTPDHGDEAALDYVRLEPSAAP